MKNIKLYITCGVIAVIITLIWYSLTDTGAPPVPQPEVAIKIPVEKKVIPIIPIPSKQSRYYVKPEILPLQFARFHDMKPGEQLNLITGLMKNKKLSQEIIDFLKIEIFNRNDKKIRNNMANALCWQHNSDPELHKLFILMLDDKHEDPNWRDYCLQFLSECFESSNNKPLIIETWIRYSKGKDSLAGTALIHLALQEGNNNIIIEPDYMIEHLEDSKVSIHTKTSILAIIGKRKDVEQLPVLRKYASQDKNAALKANAIGSLGLIGEEQDLKIVNLALYHDNGRVVLAARAAKKRIEKRIFDEEIMNKVMEAMEQIKKKKKYPKY